MFAAALTAGTPKAAPGPYLEVQSVATGLATLYERLRNTLDFRDEHLIRIYAIRRILKRRLVRGARADRMTVPLLHELIRSGYIEQTAIPESAVPGYEKLVTKYIQLFSMLAQFSQGRVDPAVWDWVFTLAANELEEKLVPMPHRQHVVEELVSTVLREHLLAQWELSDNAQREQAIVAVHRMLLKLNNELISWHLFKQRHSEWTRTPNLEQIQRVAAALPKERGTYEAAVRNPAADRLARALKPMATTVWLLLDGLEEQEDKEFILEHPEQLKSMMRETVQKHYKNVRKRLRRTLWRSLTYIFLTKMALALLVELPADRFLEGSVNVFNIAFNLLVPILLLLIFGLSVRVPGDRNTAEILTIAERLVYEGRLGIDRIRAPAPHRVALSRAFNFFYGVIYLVTFGAIVLFLLRLNFSLVGILLFLFFLTIVSFFGFRIREQAQELIVTKGQERFLVFIPVLFFLPILRTGRWIAQQSAKINLFLYFFDLFIETPLQAFLEFFDQFTGFVREKKEDITS